MDLRALLVSNVIHNLCEESSNRFQGFETAKQILVLSAHVVYIGISQFPSAKLTLDLVLLSS